MAQAKEQKENERRAKEAAEEEARNAQAYADAEALLASGDYDGAKLGFGKLLPEERAPQKDMNKRKEKVEER